MEKKGRPDKYNDTSRGVKKKPLSGQAKMSLRDDATWKDIGLTDYSDSLVVSLDFQTTTKKKN